MSYPVLSIAYRATHCPGIGFPSKQSPTIVYIFCIGIRTALLMISISRILSAYSPSLSILSIRHTFSVLVAIRLGKDQLRGPIT
jgi:hypothetical protein